MEAYGWEEFQLHAFLISELVTGELLATRFEYLTTGKRHRHPLYWRLSGPENRLPNRTDNSLQWLVHGPRCTDKQKFEVYVEPSASRTSEQTYLSQIHFQIQRKYFFTSNGVFGKYHYSLYHAFAVSLVGVTKPISFKVFISKVAWKICKYW